MKNENSKLVLGLLVGAVVGTAVGYLCTTDKKEKWIEDATSLLEKAKNNLKDVADSVKVAANKTKSNCATVDVAEVGVAETVITEE